MRCVITQPTFLPWLGWFDLVDQSDLLIFLDDVQFSKQSWQQRNRIRTRKGLEFMSVPVKTAGLLGQKIHECELADAGFFERMTRTLQASYARAPYSAEVFSELAELSVRLAGVMRLLDLNIGLIQLLARSLGVTTPMRQASALASPGQRGEHVAALCEAVGADVYLSTPGAEAYLLEDRDAFDRRGIAVMMHVYEHPEYTQRYEPFLPYASALDCVFNTGPEARAVMQSGRRPFRPLGKPADI